MNPENEWIAKELFREYDGAVFLMSLDDFLSRAPSTESLIKRIYLNYHVPKETEVWWWEELITERLQQAIDPQDYGRQLKGFPPDVGYGKLFWLLKRNDYLDTAKVFAARRRSSPAEHCLCLELLFEHLRHDLEMKFDKPKEWNNALQVVAEQARALIPRARTDTSSKKIDQLLEKVGKARTAQL